MSSPVLIPSPRVPRMASPTSSSVAPYSLSTESLGPRMVRSNTSVLGWQEGRSLTPGRGAGKGARWHREK